MADPRVVVGSEQVKPDMAAGQTWFDPDVNSEFTLGEREGYDLRRVYGYNGQPETVLGGHRFRAGGEMVFVRGPAASPPKVEPPAVPMALVGETWRWRSGIERSIVRDSSYVCTEGGVQHNDVETDTGGSHCPVLIAKCCTRISPAPQQPAPAIADLANAVRAIFAAAPEVVPEAPTEPAQLPPCGRLTPAGYPCEVRGEHPATGCRVLTEAPARQPALVYAHEGALNALCYCSSCYTPRGLSEADIAALARWPRHR